jgi:hypothetical protein
MKQIGKIEIYHNDFEIIDILKEFKPIPVAPFNGQTLLQYIDNNSLYHDFGITIPLNNVFYLIYKFGKETDSGLLLIKCKFENTAELIPYIEQKALDIFPDEKIRASMISDLLFFCRHFELIPKVF